jgi:hypothetical protein
MIPMSDQCGARTQPLAPLLATLALLCIALKVLVLALPPLELSPVHIPGNLPGLPGYEEWRRGMAAEEWLRGPLLPYLDYQQGHFQGGTLVTIGLAALSFAAFGASPFAMRLPNVLFDVAGLVALVWLVDRFCGRRAAKLTGLFALVASPGYWVVGAAAWASHVESNGQALVLLAVWAQHVFGCARSGAPQVARARSAFVLGVLAGLALWYHYGVAVWLAAMLLVELLHAPRTLVSRAMAWRILGVVVGLTPWFVYNVQYDWAGVGLYGRSADQHVQLDVSAAWAAFRELWIEFLPGSTWIPDFFGIAGSGRALGHVAVGLAFVAWLAAARRGLIELVRRRRVGFELVFVLQPPLWALLYSFGEFHGDPKWAQGHRYMLAIHPAAWALGGIGLARSCAVSSDRARAWARTACGIAYVGVAVLVLGLVSLLRPAHLALAFEAPGQNPELLGRWLFHRRLSDPDVLVRAVERLVAERDPAEADIVLFVLGNTLAFQALAAPPMNAPPGAESTLTAKHERARAEARAASAALERVVPPAYRPYFAPLQPGEGPWPWVRRDQFWRQWDRRGGGRPEGAYAR